MNKSSKIAVWILLFAAAVWLTILTVRGRGEPRHWQPNPEIGHRAAHQSGNPPPYNK